MSSRLKRVTDLYVVGKTVQLSDGTPVWVRVLNPFEQDAARSSALVAKSRLALALREHGTDEQAKVRSLFLEDGPVAACSRLVEAKLAERVPRIAEQLRYDPKWVERLDVLDQGLNETAVAVEPIETELLESIAEAYQAELNSRVASEREFLEREYGSSDPEALWKEYLDWYIERRVGEVMLAELRLAQMQFGTFWCEGILTEGSWDHSNCNGHTQPLFESAQEAREAPTKLMLDLVLAIQSLDMSSVEAKNSDRLGSSFDSSPQPSEAEESTFSTQNEIPPAPLGS